MTFSFYTTIHKAIRMEISEVCILAGRTDFADKKEAITFKERFLSLLNFLKSHSEHEHAFIHPLLEKIDTLEFDKLEDEHRDLEKDLDKLEKNLNKILNIEDEIINYERGLQFYLALNQFSSDYLVHLHHEETKIMPLLNKTYSLEDLMKVMVQFKKSIPPEETRKSFVLMFKSMNSVEILQLLDNIKKSATDEVYMGVSLLAKEVLSENMWNKTEGKQ